MEVIDRLDNALSVAETRINRRVGEAKQVFEAGRRAEHEVTDLEARLEVLESAIEVLNSYADQQQEALQRTIETLVTHGLRTIFGPEMSFHVRGGMKGKYATIDFVVRTVVDGESIDTPVMDARGGGVAAVVGFLLRLVLLLLHPGKRHILFLDETFAQLSADYENRLAEFIRELVDKRPDIQIVMVTHSDQYGDVADRSYRFRLEDGITKVERLG
jgi:DNA repair exonuclease SbcCD ATPase subunit